MPKLGRSYTVDVLVPENGEGELLPTELPEGFVAVAGGRGAVRITARDRDKFGAVATIDHLVRILEPNDLQAPGWAEALRHCPLDWTWFAAAKVSEPPLEHGTLPAGGGWCRQHGYRILPRKLKPGSSSLPLTARCTVMPDNPVLSMTLGPVPEPVAPIADSFGATSVVLRAGPEQQSQGPKELAWLSQGLMGIRTASLMDRVHDAQQEARRQKAEDEPAGRASRDTDVARRGGRFGATGDYVDPPFDLHRLAFLLYLSPDYFAVVDQMAIDIAGDWLLVDRSRATTRCAARC